MRTAGYGQSWPAAASALPRAVDYFRRRRELLWRMTLREVQARYRGSWLGPVWSLLTPLLLLGVYGFVFSVVFRARWGSDPQSSQADYILTIFGNITVFNLFAETVSAAPGLVVAHANYVKRIIFPLEILPVVRFLACAVNTGLSLAVFITATACMHGLSWTALLLPLTLLPLVFWTLGVALLLSALGVFVRDIGNVIGLLITMLLFLSPVFFPASNLPAAWQPLLHLNPLAGILGNFHRVMLEGLPPDWATLALTTSLGLAASVAGLCFFLRAKPAFADVI
ncbi:MAG: ABC transporter permease [Planctomycetes bacterium]|nr:ABC transporter permease [Planctomycetota bacterium]